MDKPKFVYVTYIRTTPEKLWRALVDPEFTRQYWCDTVQECEWKVGAAWGIVIPGGRVINSGQVLEIDPPRKLVLTWRKELDPEMRAEGHSRMTYEIEQLPHSVKLTVTHESDMPGSKLIQAVSQGWPLVLASLKSLLETGSSLEETRHWPKEFCLTEKQ